MRNQHTRRHGVGLLGRAPSGVGAIDRRLADLIVDPVAQVRELADLVRRGLLSQEEYERLKARVVATDLAVTWASADEP